MEEQEDYGFIYITENLINGKQYIGQKKFGRGHKYYLGSGTLLQKAIKKHGRENFTRNIIEVCSSKEELDEKEIFWISYYNCVEDENFYNMCYGGGTRSGSKVSKESREKMSKSAPKTHSAEHNRNMGNSKKGIPLSEESKRKISIACMGRKLSKETKLKMSNSLKGRIFSDEHKMKLSEANRRRIVTDETKDKLRKIHENYRVIQLDLDENIIKTWNSLSEIKRELGFDKSFISRTCNGKHKTAYGYKWKYPNSS